MVKGFSRVHFGVETDSSDEELEPLIKAPLYFTVKVTGLSPGDAANCTQILEEIATDWKIGALASGGTAGMTSFTVGFRDTDNAKEYLRRLAEDEIIDYTKSLQQEFDRKKTEFHERTNPDLPS